jgi:aminomethyltransferase
MESVGMKQTPLFERHVALGARIVPFAGYDMPVQYTSVMAEARAVRESVGMFDVSHMARLTFSGTATVEFLESITTNDVSKLTDGNGQYSLLTNDHGGVIDDIIVYRVNDAQFKMVVNASNHEKDVTWIKSHLIPGVELTDTTDESAMIAVQGPKASIVLPGLADLPFFGTRDLMIAEVQCFCARSGYTGEGGFELVCAAEQAEKLWEGLLRFGVTPCGLASRDTLRVEAGLPLYGHELNDEWTPVESGVAWAVSKTKTFIGSSVIAERRVTSTPQRVMGIQLPTKRLLLPEMEVFLDGSKVGQVLSGVISPVLDCGIGTVMIDRTVKEGAAVTVEIRGKQEPATIVNKRFYRRS